MNFISMAEETLPDDNMNATHTFETLARSWLATRKSVNPSDVETWLQSNNSSIPDHIKSMPPSDVYQLITSFSTHATPEKDPFYFRFQRSDEWMPVYNWLESLNTNEVVNKTQVQDWLTENAEIMEDVSAKHRGTNHLVHYIRKCHKKILKKREKKEGLHTRVKKSSSKAHKTEKKKSPAMLPSSSATKLPKDSPTTYMVKRNEAFQKYQILTELEKQLGAMFRNQETSRVVTGP